MPKINKELIKHLSELSRIKLTDKEEKELSKDLEKILDYFEELKSLNTKDIEPMSGGTDIKNVFREDKEADKEHGIGTESFPETKDGFLKVPKVFE